MREVTVQDSLPGLKINQQGAGRVFDFQDGGVSKMYLPDGGNMSLVGSLVFDLANDVTITPANPASPRALTIPDPGADDTFVFLGATQTLTGKTLTGPTIQGTVGGGTGLTMPAFTASGNITGGSGFQIATSAGDLLFNPAGTVLAQKRLAFVASGASRNASLFTTNTQLVSTAKTIAVGVDNTCGHWFFVSGRKHSDTSVRFVDIVVLLGTVVSVLSSVVSNAPDARTYTFSVDNLQLAMAANTYDVQATEIMNGVPD